MYELDIEAPEKVGVGKAFDYSVAITNIGESAECSYKVLVTSAPEYPAEHILTQGTKYLMAGQTLTFSKSNYFSQRGIYRLILSANGEMTQTLINCGELPKPVFGPTEYELTLALNKKDVGVGGRMDVTATITNIGDLNGKDYFELLVDNEIRLSSGGYIWAPGQVLVIKKHFVIREGGLHKVSLAMPELGEKIVREFTVIGPEPEPEPDLKQKLREIIEMQEKVIDRLEEFLYKL